jgi:hypothetical protein
LPVLLGGTVGLALLGFVVGSGGAFLQEGTIRLGLRWPVGAAFSVLVLGACAFSAGLVIRSRLGIGMVTIGWVISVLLFTSGRPEGDVIVAADVEGYGYLLGGMFVLAALATLPYSALASRWAE